MDSELATRAREALLRAKRVCAPRCRAIVGWARAHRAATAGICAGCIVVVFLVVFACSFSASLGHVQRTGQQLADEYQALAECIVGGDASGASERSNTICELADTLEGETSTWTWGVAQAAPFAGGDVHIARELASVNKRMARETIAPFVESYAQLVGTDDTGGISIFGLTADSAALASLRANIHDAQPTVDACSQTLQGLGPARSKELQDTLETVRAALGVLGAGLAELDTLLPTTDGIGDTITSLLP